MAKHEFGLMERAPEAGERYDRYEPQKYDCISVKDDLMDEMLAKLLPIPVYWHSLDWPAHGLDEAGITLIPPESIKDMLSVLEGAEGFEELCALLKKACAGDRFVIHFGI